MKDLEEKPDVFFFITYLVFACTAILAVVWWHDALTVEFVFWMVGLTGLGLWAHCRLIQS